MRVDNTHYLLAAARQRTIETRQRAVTALRRLDATGQPVTFDAVAREAGVSRSWLYSQLDLRADNTHFLVQAARRRSQTTRERAIQTLRRLAATGDPVTFDTVARTAGVSRSWLYAQPDLRVEIGRLRAQHQEGQGRASGAPTIPARQRASDASLRRRMEAVNAEIRRLRAENQQLREQLAWALGERRAAASRSSSDDRSATIGPCS
jgi:hypothetical protein